jgi:hypothetical protein
MLRQWSKLGPLQLNALAVVGISPTDDLVYEAAVGIEIVEVATAAQQQRIFERLLEMAMRTLDRPVLRAMSGADDLKSMSLSIRLVREGRTVEDSLREDHELAELEAEGGRLFIGQAPAVPPSWVTFIGQFATGGRPPLVNQNCAAVLFVPVTDVGPPAIQRTMVIAFGTGHHALDPDALANWNG